MKGHKVTTPRELPVTPGDKLCMAQNPNGMVYCSLYKGHLGNHAAYWAHNPNYRRKTQPAGVWS